MRRFLWVVLLAAIAIAALWIGAESWAVARARDVIADHPDMRVAGVQPLRDPSRIGMRLQSPRLEQPQITLAPDWLELWISPLTPLSVSAVPAGSGRLDLPGRSLRYGISDAQGRLSWSMLDGMALSHLSLDSGPVTLEGRALLERLNLRVDRVGADLAHDLRLHLDGFHADAIPGLAPLPLPGALSVEGSGRIWLAPASGGADAAPVITGLAAQGLDIRFGDLRARLIGHVRQDSDGRAEGRLALYTADAEAVIRAAVETGQIPRDGQLLVRAMLNQMNRMPMPAPIWQDGLDFPDPRSDETRIPVGFRDGQLFLGAMPIGPAPRFPG